MSAALRDEIYRFIKAQRYGVVSSMSAQSAPQSALVGIAVSPALEIYFDTVGSTHKASNLRRDPRVAIVTGWDNEQSVQIEGVADEPKDDELAALKRIYFAAWPDGPSREGWDGITWVRVQPHWIRFSDFNRTADAVREITL